MAFTLPQQTDELNTKFTTTWYDIKAEAADNVMLATPIWAALVERGRIIDQRGGTKIERTIEYQLAPAVDVEPGYIFEAGDTENRTVAFWPFRYIGANITRTLEEDRENFGQYKIISYVENKLNSTRKGLKTKFENVMLGAGSLTEAYTSWASLNDLIPALADATTGTWGKIARPATYGYEVGSSGVKVGATGNAFWGPKYLTGTAPVEMNYERDLTSLWNSIHNNQEAPDLILTTKAQLEIYEAFCSDKTQLVKNEGSMMAQLGYTTFKFKGSDLTWSPNVGAGKTKILTTDHLDIVIDPGMWFDMTQWKPTPNSTSSFAQILCAGNMVSDEPRRFGQLEYA